MYDKTLIFEALQNIEEMLHPLLEGTADIENVNDLFMSPEEVLRLRGICMSLQTVGETVKSIDKRTEGTLLPKYPEIDWHNIMRMRDIIAHHYFEVNVDVVFDTLRHDIPTLLDVILRMQRDLHPKIV
ncbi:hypothetical protein AGMMS49965_11720 [Bacteroidia bacterium]|nr:hypothetical protein AGMMS49965_11720 [Bacteroidia bacterium]